MNEDRLRQIAAKLGIRILGRSREWLNARCPFAEWLHPSGTDNRPSFGVKIAEGARSAYKCHTCHQHGRISGLVRALEHYREANYGEIALEADLADMSADFGDFDGTAVEPDDGELIPLEEAAYAGIYPSAWEVPDAREYLKARGIGPSTVATLALGFDPEEFRITFPVRDEHGRLFGYTGRSILEKDQYPYRFYPKVRDFLGLPKRALLLGAHLRVPGKPTFAVEGLFGLASLIEQGVREICNPVALMGSEMTSEKAHTIIMWDDPTFLMADNDEAGESCLFGNANPNGSWKGDGAVDALVRHIPIFVPEWPVWVEAGWHNGQWHDATQPKVDPDELSFDDVAYILANTPPFSLSR